MVIAALIVAIVAALMGLYQMVRAGALREEIASMRERLARLEERSSKAIPIAERLTEPEPVKPVPPPEPKIEAPVAKEPVPKPEPKKVEVKVEPKPEPPPPKSKVLTAAEAELDRLMRGHATQMVKNAYDMTAHLGFEAIPDSKRAPTVYRIVVDLRSELEMDTAKWLSENPFECLKKVELRRDNKVVLLVDKSKSAPVAVS